MLRKILFILRLLSLFFLLAYFSTVYAETNLTNQYRCIEKEGKKIHVLEIDPDHYKMIIVKTNSEAPALETVSSAVAKFGAIAGVNGGFFYLDDKKKPHPSGPLKIQGKWLGQTSKPRAAIGWNEDKANILIDRIVTKKVSSSGLPQIKVVPEMNQDEKFVKEWQEVDYVLGGIPLLMKNNQQIIHYDSEISSKSFLDKKHARTAVCVAQNQHILFVVAEHTKEALIPYVKKTVDGFTIPELAHFMESLGCRDAINLDGGGSSVMVLNQRIMNDSAGDMDEIFHVYHERPVLNAILILPKK